jgi:putative SOS response-associated peptidase YedK
MCGRFTLSTRPQAVATLFGLGAVPDLPPRYNLAPTQPLAVVRQGDAGRSFSLMRWGLVPSWADDLKIGNSLINARCETVAQKPAFRTAFRRRRCLLPADGFYEWGQVGPKKQPYHFRMRDASPFAFAGLWEEWHSPEGEAVQTCCIITTAANAVVQPVHERMPVILAEGFFDRWLDPAYDRVDGLLPLLQPFPDAAMEGFAVSTRVNSPRFEGPECLEPAA